MIYMTDVPVPSPEVPKPKQPHIEQVSWGSSQAKIYNPKELFAQALSDRLTIYDRSDFGTPIERARIGIEPVVTTEDEPAVGMSALIQLDRSTTSMDTYVERFEERFAPKNGNKVGYDIEVDETIFKNMFGIVDRRNSVKMFVNIYRNGRVTITNQKKAFSANDSDSRSAEIHAPPVNSVNAIDQLNGLSRIFMRTMVVVNSVTSENGKSALQRTYLVGEESSPFNFHTATVRSLGAQGVDGATERASSSSRARKQEGGKPTPSPDTLGKELGITIGEDQIVLDDIGGLDEVKSKLRDIATSFANVDVMAKWGAKRPQGVLMYGEPGTGKTMLVQALANEIGADLWKIQGSDIYNMWLGNSESKVKELFTRARQLEKPTVILFDEFDSIIGTTEEPGPGGAGAARNGVAGIFKQEMNDLAQKNPNILVVATTNNPDRIDAALIRSGRFDHSIYIPMPDEEGRAEIIAGIVTKTIIDQEDSDFKPFADGLDINKLAIETDGMSGADLTEIFRRIGLKKAMQEARTGSADPISQEDLEAIIRDFRTQG